MELLQLKYFAEAAKLENVSAAARRLGIPQSSVSHAIRRLEDELGQELFTRQGWHIKLNEKGIAFCQKIQAALENIDSAVADAKCAAPSIVTVVCLNMSRLMPDIITGFQRICPNVNITIYYTKKNGYDMLIDTLPHIGDDEFTKLFTERILIAVSADSPLAKNESVRLSEIKGMRVFGLAKGQNLEKLVFEYCARAGFVPRADANSDTPFVLSSVENNLGVAFIPEYSWRIEPSDRIKMLPVADFECTRTLGIFTKKDVELSPDAEKFKSFVVEYIKKTL